MAIRFNLPSAPRRHTAGGYCFALPQCQRVASSGACIGAGTIFGGRLSPSFRRPTGLPTGEPIIGVPLFSSTSGGISCAPSGAIETLSLS